MGAINEECSAVVALPCAWRDLKTRSPIIPVVVRKGLMSGFPLTCGRLNPIQPIYILRYMFTGCVEMRQRS